MTAAHAVLQALLRLQSLLCAPLAVMRPKIRGGEGGYIFGQGSLKGQRLYLAGAENTACEAVAVYNAAKSFGIGVSLGDVERAFLARGALTLFVLGFFGGNPYSIKRVLSRFGLRAKKEDPRLILGDGRYILSFWNGKKKLSLHTVFIRVEGGAAEIYNMYPNDRAPRRVEPKCPEGLSIRLYSVTEK